MKRLGLVLALVACNSRTEMMFGVATDLRAPDAIDTVQLDVLRVDNGFLAQQVVWDISGQLNQPFNLPGSYGVFSDGEEIQLDVRLTGIKNNEQILSRRSVVTLVEGETLFYRIGLSGGCIEREDCPDTHSCVEGVCRDVNVASVQLPDFTAQLVDELTCTPGVNYINTATNEAMPLSADAAECPAGLCLEGTCLKPLPEQSGTRTVRGSQIVSFVQPNSQIINRPRDLSQLDVAVIVADDNGGFDTIPGVGNADGTFAIQDVPLGTYTLKVDAAYTVTAADNVDLGFVDLGRPDKTPVVDTANTGFNLDVTGMAPWEDDNFLSAYAPQANAWWFFFDQIIASPPTVGQAALNNVAVSYSDSGNGVDNTANAAVALLENDAFALLQYTSKLASDGVTKYQTPAKVLETTVTTTEGQLQTISGAFADVPQTETISFDVRQLEWDASVGWNGTNATLLNPSATGVDSSIDGSGAPGSVSLDLFGQPGGGAYGQFSATLDYLFVTAPAGKNTMFSELTFGKPHISGYVFAPILFAGPTFVMRYQLPGTAGPVNQFLTLNTQRAADTDLLVVTPPLGPVRDATINDRSIFTAQDNVPPTSRISWKAPSLGSASMYTVTFFKLGVNQNTNNTTKTQVAVVRTTDTFLDVPPGILESGQSYFFLIRSTLVGNIDSPSRNRLPSAFVPVASAIIQIGLGGDVPSEADASTGTPDAPAGGEICNPFTQQGCQAGQKCTAEADVIRCAPNGAVAINGICAGDGPLDDCTSGGICIFQTCRAFCPTDGDTQGCAVNETCHQFGVFNSCLANCDVLAPSCAATAAGAQNCYETTFGGECINSSANAPVGSSCSFLNDCTAGSGCVGNTCLEYCDFAQFP
ncbi:MAG: hypothetical protein H0V17_11975, partial [Deltaproteobacteria bacterium]|nr:hypothetical protein [Deltaproteobacteria bacterium]